MSALLKVLRESAMSWEDIGGEGGRWTASSLFLSEEAINQVKDSFEVGRVFRGKPFTVTPRAIPLTECLFHNPTNHRFITRRKSC